jgi:hypothetical protein
MSTPAGADLAGRAGQLRPYDLGQRICRVTGADHAMTAAMPLLTALAQAEGEHKDFANPILTGVGLFVGLTILLIITLQFNKDR